mgnify:CR=1 FL=1
MSNKNTKKKTAPKQDDGAEGILVRATAAGFYNGTRYRAGEEFLYTSDEELGSWMEPVNGKKTGDEKPGEGASLV